MRVLLLLLVLFAWATPVQGQGMATNPVLDVGAPALDGETAIPIHHAGVLAVPWTYTFPNAAAASAAVALGNTTLVWMLGCAEGQVAIVGPASTPIQFTPGSTSYTGTARLSIQATPDTPGLRELACRIEGVAGGSVQTLQATDANDFAMDVAWNGEVTFSSVATRQAGPQKQIPYPIEVTNAGNSRVLVSWEALDDPGGRWNILVPEPLTLDAGQTATAIATVATPYDNGYNKDSGTFQIRAVVTSPSDPDLVLASQEIPLGATVRGWYVPGPSPLLAFAALALAGILARRPT